VTFVCNEDNNSVKGHNISIPRNEVDMENSMHCAKSLGDIFRINLVIARQFF
jgi:hypothetical protein